MPVAAADKSSRLAKNGLLNTGKAVHVFMSRYWRIRRRKRIPCGTKHLGGPRCQVGSPIAFAERLGIERPVEALRLLL